MLHQVPNSLLWLQILLATDMTIATDHFSLTIQAISFFSFL